MFQIFCNNLYIRYKEQTMMKNKSSYYLTSSQRYVGCITTVSFCYFAVNLWLFTKGQGDRQNLPAVIHSLRLLKKSWKSVLIFTLALFQLPLCSNCKQVETGSSWFTNMCALMIGSKLTTCTNGLIDYSLVSLLKVTWKRVATATIHDLYIQPSCYLHGYP